MDLWTARLRANRAALPWITTIPLPTAPPSDHNSTDPQNQDLFDLGLKGETLSLIFELIEANTLYSWFRPFGGEKVEPSSSAAIYFGVVACFVLASSDLMKRIELATWLKMSRLSS